MTAYALTRRPEGYTHNQHVLDGAARTVSVIFDGAQAALVKGSAMATTDAYELLTIPAGALVLNVAHKVTTVEGGTCTYDIGDTDVNGYVVAATSGNGNAATDLSSFNATATPAYGVGKYYAAADTIDISFPTGTSANVVIEVSATYLITNPVSV